MNISTELFLTKYNDRCTIVNNLSLIKGKWNKLFHIFLHIEEII